MTKMICKVESFEYPPGNVHQPGDSFEVEELHVELLQIIGKAGLPEAQAMEPARAPKRRSTRRA